MARSIILSLIMKTNCLPFSYNALFIIVHNQRRRPYQLRIKPKIRHLYSRIGGQPGDTMLVQRLL